MRVLDGAGEINLKAVMMAENSRFLTGPGARFGMTISHSYSSNSLSAPRNNARMALITTLARRIITPTKISAMLAAA